MRIVDDFRDIPPFEVLEAEAPRVPFVFDAPHSGTCYPRELVAQARLDRRSLRRSEDTFVDALFADVVQLGAPLMRAHFPRVYVDVNREETELDPAMFDGPLGVPANPESPRVAGGLGVIARIVGERAEIYRGPLPAADARRRLDAYYRPYHDTLARLLTETAEAFGTAVLVDCHSMPSGAVRTLDERGTQRPDVILGDRFGTSCGPQLTDELGRLLRDHGLAVGRNRPYAGGFITERYGRPPAIHAIQIEINRALYMDEATFAPTSGFEPLRRVLLSVFADLVAWHGASRGGAPWPLAAE
jgi:N-formylglutamate amidohydrolase